MIAAAGGLAGTAVVALGLAPSLALALVAISLAGLFWQAFFVVALSGLEAAAPPEVAGREIGLFYALTLAGLAVGAPLTGLLLDLTGVGVGLSIVGALMVAFAVWRMVRLRRHLA